jgi:hypothetical protein
MFPDMGQNRSILIPSHPGDKTRYFCPFFHNPQDVFCIWKVFLAYPHIWGSRKIVIRRKVVKFSPVKALFPQFFTSYPQLKDFKTVIFGTEVPQIWVECKK